MAADPSRPGWLDVDIGFQSAEGSLRLSPDEVRQLLRGGRSSLRRGDRVVAIDEAACEDLEEVLRDVDPEQDGPGNYRVRAAQAGYLASVSRLAPVAPDLPELGPESLGELDSLLRPYQKDGVAWLVGRARQGFSALLADEMGLGKTLQALAAIAALRRETPDAPPSLVVCPTSLLTNWCREAARFVPDLSLLVLHGARRGRLWKQVDDHALVVTTYGLLDRDRERYAGRPFQVAVFDEASALKNPDARVTRAAAGIEASYRWALSGTPVENRVEEAWSLLQLVSPGYLGPRSDFRDRYERPLQADPPPAEVLGRLGRRLAPFVLRRSKRQVAPELPAKIRQDLRVPLTGRQRDLYTELLRAGREVLAESRGGGGAAARMHVLTALLRLRQVCCHPALVDPEGSWPDAESAKTAALLDLVDRSVAEDHPMLVFSQFVGMLRRAALALEERRIRYAYLDGGTGDRQRQVDRFQGGEVPVFLISLKAGGYGLNLTRADTVVHYDPWWNPAVEAQAEDRAHRIGQERPVTVYRLLAEETVEEGIVRMQRRKRMLMDAAVNDEAPLMRGLSEDDLAELLG